MDSSVQTTPGGYMLCVWGCVFQCVIGKELTELVTAFRSCTDSLGKVFYDNRGRMKAVRQER